MADITWTNCVDSVPDVNGTTQKVPTLQCIGPVFQNILTALLGFAGIIAVIMIILGAIKMINSGGDPKQVAGARQTLTFAIIGLVIIFLSFFIINVIAYTTGARCITKFGFTNCK